MTMSSDEFWTGRLIHAKSRLITDIIEYCLTYEILYDEAFNANSIKANLAELIDKAIEMYITDN